MIERFHSHVSPLLVFVACLALAPQSARATCDEQTVNRYGGGWPKELDTNLYWIGPDDKTERATGQPSDFYDPGKKTVILIDGWDGWDKVSSCHRMTSRCFAAMNCHDSTVYSQRWLEQGWNFGIFYWDQFADTTCTIDAEAVIWDNDLSWKRPWGSKDESPPTMPWKSYDVQTQATTTHNYVGTETSIGQLCANILRRGMLNFRGEVLQLVGLSLGSQLVASCAYELHQKPESGVLPTRITLLDPIFTEFLKGASPACFGRSWDYKYTTRRTMDALNHLWLRGVPMELYKSSLMTEWRTLLGWNPALEMETMGATVYLDPRYCGYGMAAYHCRHEAAVPIYFSRMGVSHEELGENCTVPGPRCTDTQLRNLIIAEQVNITQFSRRTVYHQVSGRSTVKAEDDTYAVWIQGLPTDARLPALKTDAMVSNPTLRATESRHNLVMAKVASPDSGGNTHAVASAEIEEPPMFIVLFAITAAACLGVACCYAVMRTCFGLRVTKRSCQIRASDSDRESLTWHIEFGDGSRSQDLDNESLNSYSE